MPFNSFQSIQVPIPKTTTKLPPSRNCTALGIVSRRFTLEWPSLMNIDILCELLRLRLDVNISKAHACRLQQTQSSERVRTESNAVNNAKLIVAVDRINVISHRNLWRLFSALVTQTCFERSRVRISPSALSIRHLHLVKHSNMVPSKRVA